MQISLDGYGYDKMELEADGSVSFRWRKPVVQYIPTIPDGESLLSRGSPSIAPEKSTLMAE